MTRTEVDMLHIRVKVLKRKTPIKHRLEITKLLFLTSAQEF